MLDIYYTILHIQCQLKFYFLPQISQIYTVVRRAAACPTIMLNVLCQLVFIRLRPMELRRTGSWLVLIVFPAFQPEGTVTDIQKSFSLQWSEDTLQCVLVKFLEDVEMAFNQEVFCRTITSR